MNLRRRYLEPLVARWGVFTRAPWGEWLPVDDGKPARRSLRPLRARRVGMR